jgi:hypothetical protein
LIGRFADHSQISLIRFLPIARLGSASNLRNRVRQKSNFAWPFRPIQVVSPKAQKFIFRFSENCDCMRAS